MKKRLVMVFLGLMLIGGTAWAVPDGIWKNTTGTPAYSFYIQTYIGNAMLVIVAPNTEVFWVFLDEDDDYTNGFSANEDLAGTPHRLTIAFSGDDAATAGLTFAGESSVAYTLTRNAQAPSSGGNGNPPTGILSSPTDGQIVGGTVSIAGNASDDLGLDRVGISINGAPEIDASLSAATGAYTYTWNTFPVPNGSHSIVVTAYDIEGLNAVIGDIIVTVSNGS